MTETSDSQLRGPNSKSDIQAFWGSLYHSLYDDVESTLTRERLSAALDALEDMFRLRRHMSVVEMPLKSMTGKRVLEVGPGAGAHSALFARHGALVTAVDITFPRARATAAKLALIDGPGAASGAIQADAERLPFADNTFDIVYSNGVLHHTHDTEAAVAEAYRVLKPGGQAVIMLYCKSSWHYWINLVLLTGLVRGAFMKGRNWVGHVTEWGGRERQTIANPVTRCYTRRGMELLFDRFEQLTLRKSEFYFYLIPGIGRFYRRWQLRRYGTHPGGYLVYGEPWPRQSPLEQRLGSLIGWSWYAAAVKPNTHHG
jgi:ubiquinone/menaquinone biosynthesis C-methylase UbiE